MTAARRLTALALLALLAALPTRAVSAEADGHAWWWRPQTGLLGVELPPPPDVPSDGLLVERGPDAAMALTAVRFTLSEGEVDPVLTLTIASEQGGAVAAIAACPITSRWTPEHGGRWDTAPGFDCEAGRVDGVRADDGSAWTWELAPLVTDDGLVDVMLVDGTATPFHVAFDGPTDASLATTTVPAPPPAADPTPAAPAARERPLPPPPPTGGPVSAPSVTSDVEAPADPGRPAAPEVAGADPADPVPPRPVAAPVTPEDGLSPLAFALIAAIGLLVLADVASAARGGGRARPWRAAAATVGGIGRFRRERDQPPAPLC